MDFTDRTVGRYRVLNRLGEGGMGVVYRAVDTQLNRVVAIKFLPQHLWLDTTARNRMIAEAQAASGLDHPNIATIYEIGDSPDTGLYIVMAFYSGEPLSRHIRSGPLTLAQSLDIATQVARGLALAHEHGITHRDIKPDNIMLMQNGLVKILDFGLAKSENLDLTDAGAILGTPAFMAPEQIRGERVDHRCDLWSLGVVLFNMLTGRRPFAGASIHVLAQQILEETPEMPAIPAAVQRVLKKALAKTAAQRFQSANELIIALGSCSSPADPDATVELTAQQPYASLSRGIGGLGPDETTAAGGLGIAGTGEFRQITLVSCELAEPGAIETACGLEAFHKIQLAYDELCFTVARRLGGEAAPLSDTEVRLHFGYPQALEDDAVRAVTAGLEIAEGMVGLQEIWQTKFPELVECTLRVRVGIHTGSVIASGEGKQIGQRAIFGSAGMLASQIQRAATQGGVWITADTLNLVRGFFNVQKLGETPLSHLSRPVALYSVLGKTSAATRLEAAGILTELVSRERELGTLIDCWSETKDGHGHAVLLSGDAGIGKSRLVRALHERLADQRPLLLEARSSPYHSNTPLHPIIEMLGQLFGFERSESTETRVDRLRLFLSRLRFSSADGLAVIAPLLSQALPAGVAVAKLEPQRQKEKNLSTILKLLETIAAKTPVLWIVEDLHWADPTTIELLSLMVERDAPARILTVMTARAEFSPPWVYRSSVKPIHIGRLSRREVELMIQRLAGGKHLPKEVTTRLVENAEGVPLFVEELTRNVLTSGVLRETPEGYQLAGPIASLAIPSTLQDSLMARLDRLGEAKEVAQVASVLGRTFSREWLQAICPLEASLLNDSLWRLVDADVLFREAIPSEGKYTFKHALIKDAAYNSMLASTRQEYHERFARILERVFPETAELHPELVAHHFTDAGLYAEAISYWRRAGEDARRRSANIEAAAHYRRGLELTAYLPQGIDRVQAELGLWTALASAQLTTEGYGASSVGDSFRRVRELGHQAGLSRPLFDALQGQWAFQVVRGELETALETSSRLTEIAVGLGDPALRLEAILRQGIALSIAGELAEARRCLEEVDSGSGVVDHRGSAFLFGQDRLVACLCHLALVLCLQGHIRDAAETAGRAVGLARELAHPFSLSWAYLYAGMVQSLCGDAPQTREYADALKLLSEEQGFSYRLAQAHVLGGWAMVFEFEDEAGLAEIRDGITAVFGTGARVYGPLYHALLAEAYLKLGLVDMGFAAIGAGLNENPRTAERVFEAQLLCLRAELLARKSGDNQAEVIRTLTGAVEIARKQGARLLELRALISLAAAQPGNPEVLNELRALLRDSDWDGNTLVVASARVLAARGAQ